MSRLRFSSGHVWMWELDYKESWAPKNWCFWTVVLEDLRVPWTARRSNQSILKEISPGCLLKGLMLKLKLQYFGHLMWRANSLQKTLMLGKTEGRRRRGWQRMRWLDGITDSMDMGLGRFRELVREAWHAANHGVEKSRTLPSDWTELNWTKCHPHYSDNIFKLKLLYLYFSWSLMKLKILLADNYLKTYNKLNHIWPVTPPASQHKHTEFVNLHGNMSRQTRRNALAF